METGKKGRILIDLEKLNTLGSRRCSACGRTSSWGRRWFRLLELGKMSFYS